MKIEIIIDVGIGEPFVVIHVPEMTPEVMAWIKILEEAEGKPSVLIAKDNDKILIFQPEQIEIIRSEGDCIKLYNQNAQGYIATKPLYEIGEQLGKGFVRISKSAIINFNRVDYLSPSFNGTMRIAMKNGIDDYISRKYLGDFKKRLGL